MLTSRRGSADRPAGAAVAGFCRIVVPAPVAGAADGCRILPVAAECRRAGQFSVLPRAAGCGGQVAASRVSGLVPAAGCQESVPGRCCHLTLPESNHQHQEESRAGCQVAE